MISFSVVPKKARRKDGNRLFTVLYGDSDVVDVRARSMEEAEEKFLFVLLHELRGKTIDFDIRRI